MIMGYNTQMQKNRTTSLRGLPEAIQTVDMDCFVVPPRNDEDEII
jgi:hypothetical protein